MLLRLFHKRSRGRLCGGKIDAPVSSCWIGRSCTTTYDSLPLINPGAGCAVYGCFRIDTTVSIAPGRERSELFIRSEQAHLWTHAGTRYQQTPQAQETAAADSASAARQADRETPKEIGALSGW